MCKPTLVSDSQVLAFVKDNGVTVRHECYYKGHALLKQLLHWGVAQLDTLPLSLVCTLGATHAFN